MLSIFALVISNINSHVTEVCAGVENNVPVFYGCTYHGSSEFGVVGGLYIDGTRHDYTEMLDRSEIPTSMTCDECPLNDKEHNYCLKMAVYGIFNGFHTVVPTCDTKVDCPNCTFPEFEIRGVQDDVCDPDNDAPILTCPDDVTLVVNRYCQANVPDCGLSATFCDRCSNDLVFTQDVQIGQTLGLGQHVVTISGQDEAGNIGECTTTLDVVDGTPPSVSLTAYPSSISLYYSPNRRIRIRRQNPMVRVTVYPTVFDNCCGTPTCYIDHVVVDDNVIPSSNNDWQIVGSSQVLLRAISCGAGQTRNYIIVVYCVDDYGNVGVDEISIPVY